MSAGVLSGCTKGVFNRALSRSASAPSGLAVEARTTRSSKEGRSGFCDRSAKVSACDSGRDFSCATHEDNAIPRTRPQCRAIFDITALFTCVPSNILQWIRRAAYLRGDLPYDDPAMQAR